MQQSPLSWDQSICLIDTILGLSYFISVAHMESFVFLLLGQRTEEIYTLLI